MQLDLESLRHQYQSLSDEALLEIDRSDLVPDARTCYEAEVKRRKLLSAVSNETELSPTATAEITKPDWAGDAAEVFTELAPAGYNAAERAQNARDALNAAGIPCYLEYAELPEEPENDPPSSYEWRVLVPGNLHLQAMSILDRDIFNQEFEDEWRTHLGMLCDSEVRELIPENCFCGLFDRIERINRVYAEELARRGLV